MQGWLQAMLHQQRKCIALLALASVRATCCPRTALVRPPTKLPARLQVSPRLPCWHRMPSPVGRRCSQQRLRPSGWASPQPLSHCQPCVPCDC